MASVTTLTSNKDFRTLYYRGKSALHPAVVLYVRRNRLGHPRIGLTVGKKVGNAVTRNRCRRIIREALKDSLPSVKGGWDIVIVARTRLVPMKSTDLSPVLMGLFRQCGVLK